MPELRVKQHLTASVSGLKGADVLLPSKVIAGFFRDRHEDHFNLFTSPLSHLKNGNNTSQECCHAYCL